MTENISERVAIVTGASGGLGREFALYAHRYFNFDTLILVARRADKLKEVAKEVLEEVELYNSKIKKSKKKAGGQKAIKVEVVPLELTAKSALDFGTYIKGRKVALLVNNAGFGTYGEFLDTDVEKSLAMIDLNCAVVVAFCAVCLPLMERGAALINIASMAAFAPLGNFALYAATKSFVKSFSLALRAEVKKLGVKVCAVCPGSVSTDFALVASGGARKVVKGGCSPKKVAVHALKSARRGGALAIMSAQWKFCAFFAKLLPSTLIANFTQQFCKRPHV